MNKFYIVFLTLLLLMFTVLLPMFIVNTVFAVETVTRSIVGVKCLVEFVDGTVTDNVINGILISDNGNTFTVKTNDGLLTMDSYVCSYYKTGMQITEEIK